MSAIPPPEDSVLSVVANDADQPLPLPVHTPAPPDISVSAEDEPTSLPGSSPPEAADERDADDLEDVQALAASLDTAPLLPAPHSSDQVTLAIWFC